MTTLSCEEVVKSLGIDWEKWLEWQHRHTVPLGCFAKEQKLADQEACL